MRSCFGHLEKDGARAWDSPWLLPSPSIAAGLRAVMGKLVSAEIFWAHNFSNLDTTSEKTIQDDGVHFKLSVGWPK